MKRQNETVDEFKRMIIDIVRSHNEECCPDCAEELNNELLLHFLKELLWSEFEMRGGIRIPPKGRVYNAIRENFWDRTDMYVDDMLEEVWIDFNGGEE